MTDSILPTLIPAPAMEIELSQAETALLQQLFANYQSLTLEQEFVSGYSRARVFRITPWRAGLELAAQVVKLGHHELIADEMERHEAYVRHSLPFLAAQITNFHRLDDLAALAYTYLGGDILGPTFSLKDYYQQHSPEQNLKVLERLLVKALGRGWYGQPQTRQGPLFFEQYYGTYFPADLILTLQPNTSDRLSQMPLSKESDYPEYLASTPAWKYRNLEAGQRVQIEGFLLERCKKNHIDLIRPDGLVRIRVKIESGQLDLSLLILNKPVWVRGEVLEQRQETLAAIVAQVFAGSSEIQLDPASETIHLAGQTYPNPLKLYQTYLNQRLPRYLSIIHGDLHLFNVIVDSDHKPWLIDFGRVAEGHAIFDFIELETHLRHIVLTEAETAFSLAELVDFERRLIAATIRSESPSPPPNPELIKAFVVIQGIRAFAADYLARRDDFQGEYFPALFLYSLSTLKHYRENGVRSAQYAFVTAAILAAYLTDQLDALELSPTAPVITDPTLYLHAYYLKKAADDTPERQLARRQIFQTEVQQAIDALRQWLRLPSVQAIWHDEAPPNPYKMVLCYDSGQWQDPTGQTLAWVAVHEMNDTYLLRLILCRLGQGHPPTIFANLNNQLPWRPDSDQPEWLGQTIFYAGLSYALAQELARLTFNTSALWHTSLACGELYCPPSLDAPYLLIFNTSEQERLADAFFGQMALELGWYIHKALRQAEAYKTHLRVMVRDMEQKLSAILTAVQTLYRHFGDESSNQDLLVDFHRKIGDLEMAVLDYGKLLATVKGVLAGIKVNVKNHSQVTEPGEFMIETNQDEIFVEQRHRLARLPQQIEADLEFWQPKLEEARHTLDILRPVTERFPRIGPDSM